MGRRRRSLRRRRGGRWGLGSLCASAVLLEPKPSDLRDICPTVVEGLKGTLSGADPPPLGRGGAWRSAQPPASSPRRPTARASSPRKLTSSPRSARQQGERPPGSQRGTQDQRSTPSAQAENEHENPRPAETATATHSAHAPERPPTALRRQVMSVTRPGIEAGPNVTRRRSVTLAPTEGTARERSAVTLDCNECNEALDAARAAMQRRSAPRARRRQRTG